MPSQLQTVTGALYNTLSPVTHQGMTAEKVFSDVYNTIQYK